MRALRLLCMFVLGLLAWGCAAPIKLYLKTDPPVAATVRLRLISGEEAATPAECQAPCTVSIPPDTTHELDLQAPGYYSATMEVTYLQVMQAGFTNDADGSKQLIVPLQRRPVAAPLPGDGGP